MRKRKHKQQKRLPANRKRRQQSRRNTEGRSPQKPALRPNLDINRDAGIAALAIPSICTAIGRVARSAEGAICAPTIPQQNQNRSSCVTKALRQVSTISVRYSCKNIGRVTALSAAGFQAKDLQGKSGYRDKLIEHSEQIQAGVTHDEHRFFTGSGSQVMVIDQYDVVTVRRNHLTVERVVFSLGDRIQSACIKCLIQFRKESVRRMLTPGTARRSTSRSAAIPRTTPMVLPTKSLI